MHIATRSVQELALPHVSDVQPFEEQDESAEVLLHDSGTVLLLHALIVQRLGVQTYTQPWGWKRGLKKRMHSTHIEYNVLISAEQGLYIIRHTKVKKIKNKNTCTQMERPDYRTTATVTFDWI